MLGARGRTGKERKEGSEGHGEGERKRREVRSIEFMKEKRGGEEREEGKTGEKEGRK